MSSMELDDWASVAEETPLQSIKSEDLEALQVAEEAHEAAQALWGPDLEEADEHVGNVLNRSIDALIYNYNRVYRVYIYR